jgi:hypothetical protein
MESKKTFQNFELAETFSISPVGRRSRTSAHFLHDDGYFSENSREARGEESSLASSQYLTGRKQFPHSLEGCGFDAGGILDTINDFTGSPDRKRGKRLTGHPRRAKDSNAKRPDPWEEKLISHAIEQFDDESYLDETTLNHVLEMASDSSPVKAATEPDFQRVLSLDQLEEEDLRRAFLSDNAGTVSESRLLRPALSELDTRSLDTGDVSISSRPVTPTTLRSPNESVDEESTKSNARPMTPSAMRSPANSLRDEPKDIGPPEALPPKHQGLYIMTKQRPMDAPETSPLCDIVKSKSPDAPPQLMIRIPHDDESWCSSSDRGDTAIEVQYSWDREQQEASHMSFHASMASSVEGEGSLSGSHVLPEMPDGDADPDWAPQLDNMRSARNTKYPSVEELEDTAAFLEKIAAAPSPKEVHDSRAYLARLAKTSSPKELNDARSFFEKILEPEMPLTSQGGSMSPTTGRRTNNSLPDALQPLPRLASHMNLSGRQNSLTSRRHDQQLCCEPVVSASLDARRSGSSRNGQSFQQEDFVPPRQIRHSAGGCDYPPEYNWRIEQLHNSHQKVPLHADDSYQSICSPTGRFYSQQFHRMTRDKRASLSHRLSPSNASSESEVYIDSIYTIGNQSLLDVNALSERRLARKKPRTRSPSLQLRGNQPILGKLAKLPVDSRLPTNLFQIDRSLLLSDDKRSLPGTPTFVVNEYRNDFPVLDADLDLTMYDTIDASTGEGEHLNKSPDYWHRNGTDYEIRPVDSFEPKKKLSRRMDFENSIDLQAHHSCDHATTAHYLPQQTRVSQSRTARAATRGLRNERTWIHDPHMASRCKSGDESNDSLSSRQYFRPLGHAQKIAGRSSRESLVEIMSEDSSQACLMVKERQPAMTVYPSLYSSGLIDQFSEHFGTPTQTFRHMETQFYDDESDYSYESCRREQSMEDVRDDLIEIISVADSSLTNQRHSGRNSCRPTNHSGDRSYVRAERKTRFPPFGVLPDIPEIDDEGPDADLFRRKRETCSTAKTPSLVIIEDLSPAYQHSKQQVLKHSRKGGPEELHRRDSQYHSDSSKSWLIIKNSDDCTVPRQQPMLPRLGGPECLSLKKVHLTDCDISSEPTVRNTDKHFLSSKDDERIDEGCHVQKGPALPHIPRLQPSPPRPDKQRRQVKTVKLRITYGRL